MRKFGSALAIGLFGLVWLRRHNLVVALVTGQQRLCKNGTNQRKATQRVVGPPPRGFGGQELGEPPTQSRPITAIHAAAPVS